MITWTNRLTVKNIWMPLLRWSNHAKQRWWLRAELLCLDFFINSTLNFGHFLRHLAYYSTAVWTLLSLCSYSNQSMAYYFYKFNWLTDSDCYLAFSQTETKIAVLWAFDKLSTKICVSFGLFAHESRDLSQAETKIIVATSWANEPFLLKMVRFEKKIIILSENTSCQFVNLFSF